MATTHPSSTRRTLAIISHPDAGKTTLTEKFRASEAEDAFRNYSLMTDTPHKTLVASVFGDPDRQRDLHAILAIVPGGRPLPGTGGQIFEPGRAAAGFFGLRPMPIWCVAPVLRSKTGPAILIGAAIRHGLRLAAERTTRWWRMAWTRSTARV